MNYDELLKNVQWAVHNAYMSGAAGSQDNYNYYQDESCQQIAEAVIPVVTAAVLDRIDAAYRDGAVIPELDRIDAEWGLGR